jgi:prepilin-type N-terminal cleavage/methylation domain-containing protein/prepilin-type processing-associated H-X9-DG protein
VAVAGVDRRAQCIVVFCQRERGEKKSLRGALPVLVWKLCCGLAAGESMIQYSWRASWQPPRGGKHVVRAAFTLIELLVVVAILSLLVSILLPTLGAARARAAAIKCRANLHSISIGLVAYNAENRDYNVPSYNLPPLPGATSNRTGGPDQPLEGWAPILDRDGLVPSRERDTNTIFYCPKTVNVEGMKDGQTGADPDKPRGWTDWPLKFTAVGGDSMPKIAVTIPERRFTKIIRVSFWLNAYNPIGNAVPDIRTTDLHYTTSVGWGPDNQGRYLELHRLTCRRPPQLIVASDGIYMGRQAVTRLGDVNSRIGYRHPGMGRLDGLANVAFADGHVEPIAGDRFPRALNSSDSASVFADKKLENLSGPTIYTDPELVFP